MKTAKDRLASLLTVKSLVTLALTGVFAYMSVTGDISRDFMTIYAVIIAFYFGTQSTRADAAPAGASESEYAAGGIRSESAAASEAGCVKAAPAGASESEYAAGHVIAESAAGGIRSESAAALEAGCVKAAPGGGCPAPDGGCTAGHVTAEDEYAALPVPGGGSGGGGA